MVGCLYFRPEAYAVLPDEVYPLNVGKMGHGMVHYAFLSSVLPCQLHSLVFILALMDAMLDLSAQSDVQSLLQ